MHTEPIWNFRKFLKFQPVTASLSPALFRLPPDSFQYFAFLSPRVLCIFPCHLSPNTLYPSHIILWCPVIELYLTLPWPVKWWMDKEGKVEMISGKTLFQTTEQFFCKSGILAYFQVLVESDVVRGDPSHLLSTKPSMCIASWSPFGLDSFLLQKGH